MAAFALRGWGLPDGEPLELWIQDGRISAEPVPGAQPLVVLDGEVVAARGQFA